MRRLERSRSLEEWRVGDNRKWCGDRVVITVDYQAMYLPRPNIQLQIDP